MSNCDICNTELDHKDNPTSRNCGGTCLFCMAKAGDPEARRSMMEIQEKYVQAACPSHGIMKYLPIIPVERVADIMDDLIHDDDYDVHTLSKEDIIGLVTRCASSGQGTQQGPAEFLERIAGMIAMAEADGETKQ